MSDAKQETCFGLGGNIVDEHSALAKIVVVNSKSEHYFIWFWRGDLYDPYGPDILRKTQQFISKFKKVNKETFENYFRYLKTKNRLYLIRAKRSSMEN